MRSWLSLALSVLALAQTISVQGSKSEKVISVSGESDFDKQVKEKPLALVKFYAPWCGHCKSLAPEFEKAAEQLSPLNVPLVKVDCTASGNEDLCGKHGVRGYPTVKFFRGSKSLDYSGARSSEAIVDYMKSKLRPAISILKTTEEVDALAKSEKVAVLGLFADEKDSSKTTFDTVAADLRDEDGIVFGFAVGDAAKSIASHVKGEVPSVTLFKQFDEPKVVYTGSLSDVNDLKSFISAESVPLIADIGPENYAVYVESGLPMAYLFVSTAEERTKFGPIFKPAAQKFKGKVHFIYIDATQFGPHAENLNLPKDSFPSFAVHSPKSNLKYPFEHTAAAFNPTEEDVTNFVQAIVDGTAKPFMKSEPVPAENQGPVTVVVHDNFDEVVMDKSKDVLIEFYAPWCGHCKQLAPIWEKLGKAVKQQAADKVVIAKMDATSNDLPQSVSFQIQGFPTIKLVKAKDNSVVDYEKGRSLDDFIKFINENAANDVKIDSVEDGSHSDHDEDHDHDDEEDFDEKDEL